MNVGNRWQQALYKLEAKPSKVGAAGLCFQASTGPDRFLLYCEVACGMFSLTMAIAELRKRSKVGKRR